MRKVLSKLIPRFFIELVRSFSKFFRYGTVSPLFDGDSELFFELIEECSVYGEYGVGASTIEAAKRVETVYGVDTSDDWIKKVERFSSSDGVTLVWVDLGILGPWGRPVSYRNRDSFDRYTEGLWCQELKPDLVLIDGRFRVACFLATILHADPGVKILFDDYVDSPHYWVVEEVLAPIRCVGRQALFVVPELSAIEREFVLNLRNDFRCVFE